MANVYLALMSGPARFSKLLVLKVLREDLDASRDELVAMFLDEARLAACLQHRNIVQTYEFGEVDGRYHMAMEYLEGQTLRTIQRKLGPNGLPLPQGLRILAETARGLHHAHNLKENGTPLCVVHRDVSPQNVLLTYDGQVKLLDFGIAKTEGAEHLTRVGVIKGKIDYIAPEQVRGEDIDRRADVFSLGVMLWEAITGERFAGGSKVTEVTKFHRRLTGGEPKIRERRPDAPEMLASLVDHALALDPKARIGSAEQFADGIDAYLATLLEKPSDKSLGALLTEHFGEDHQRRRQVIDQQVQAIKDAAQLAERSLSGARPVNLGLTLTGMLDLSSPGSAAGSASSAHAVVSAARTPSDAQAAAAPWRRPAVIASAFGLFAAFGLLLILRSEGSPSVAAAAVPAASAVPVSVTAPAAQAVEVEPPAPTQAMADVVRLSVDVLPRDARVTIDGAPLPQVPFSGTFRKAGEQHQLEAIARGYQPFRQLVTFEQDRELKIVLRAAPAVVPARARPKHTVANEAVDVAPPVPAALPPALPATLRSEEPVPGTELKTKPKDRAFDMKNPYAQ